MRPLCNLYTGCWGGRTFRIINLRKTNVFIFYDSSAGAEYFRPHFADVGYTVIAMSIIIVVGIYYCCSVSHCIGPDCAFCGVGTTGEILNVCLN